MVTPSEHISDGNKEESTSKMMGEASLENKEISTMNSSMMRENSSLPRIIEFGWDITEAAVPRREGTGEIVTPKRVNYTYKWLGKTYNGWIEYRINVTGINEVDGKIEVTWNIEIKNSKALGQLDYRNAYKIIGNQISGEGHDYNQVEGGDILLLESGGIFPRFVLSGDYVYDSSLLSITNGKVSRFEMKTTVKGGRKDKHKHSITLLPLRKNVSFTGEDAQGDFETLTIYRLYDPLICKVDSAGNPITKEASFQIFKVDDLETEVASGVTDDQGQWKLRRGEDLIYANQRYVLKEIDPPEGYEASDELQFEIDEDGQYHVFTKDKEGNEQETVSNSNRIYVVNKLKPLESLKMKKIDKSTNQPLEGVAFDYYRILGDGEEAEEGQEELIITREGELNPEGDLRIVKINTSSLVTDSEGFITLTNLEEGGYALKETSLGENEGYQLLEKFSFLTRRPDGMIEFFAKPHDPDNPSDQIEIWNYKKKLPSLQLQVIDQELEENANSLTGSKWTLEKMGEEDTSLDGHIRYLYKYDSVTKDRYDQLIYLEDGEYRIKQIEAPDGYLSSPYTYSFTVESNEDQKEGVSYSSITKLSRYDEQGHEEVLWRSGESENQDVETFDAGSDFFSYVEGNALKELRLKIVNHKNHLKIQKVDKDNHALPFASFKLYQVNETEGYPHYVQGKRLLLSEHSFYNLRGPHVPQSTLFEGRTDENGQLEFNGIPEGDYFLEEIEAPSGYYRSPDFFGPYTMTKDGKLVESDLSENGEILPSQRLLDPITIFNSELIEVQATKKWEGNKPRHEDLIFSLMRKTGTQEPVSAGVEPKVLSTESTEDSVSWQGLPKYSPEGELYTYVVTELKGPYTHRSEVVLDEASLNTSIYKYTVTNTEIVYKFSIIKIDELEPNKGLKGALFKFYRIVQEEQKEGTITIDGRDYFVAKYMLAETDNDGEATVKLNPGGYLIEEYQAPEGYLRNQQYYEGIHIDPSGKITVGNTEIVGHLPIPNRRKGSLPNTGGSGVSLFLRLGFSMIFLSVIGNRFIMKRSRE